MRRLVLIRHADPHLDPNLPGAAWRLSPQGVDDAQELATRVDRGSAQHIYSSPEPKASETAAAFSERWGIPVILTPGLQEHERPEPGLMDPVVFRQSVRAVFENPADVVFGIESGDQARQRFTAVVVRLIAASSEDVVVVSHGTVMTLFVSQVTGMEPFSLWRRLARPCALTLSLPDFGLVDIVPDGRSGISVLR